MAEFSGTRESAMSNTANNKNPIGRQRPRCYISFRFRVKLAHTRTLMVCYMYMCMIKSHSEPMDMREGNERNVMCVGLMLLT